MIKVSIIVPIYNAGFRLHECLDTLINQTLHEIEIICVLDCPTDGSEKVVESFAAKDDRIKLIYNEKNLHVAESRNRGMAAAQGEYIGFSDHDDTRNLNMYEVLYEEAKRNNNDIVFSNSVIRTNETDTPYIYGDPSITGVIRSLVLGDNAKNENFLSAAVWSSIYKREFINSNNLHFWDRKKCLEEDIPFNLSAFLKASTVSYVNNTFYIWNKYDSSLSEQWGTNEGLTRLCFFELITQTLKEAGEFKRYRNEWLIALAESLRVYYFHYSNLPAEYKRRLGKLLYYGKFPILGRYEKLKIISKKRLTLYLFVLQLYIKEILKR